MPTEVVLEAAMGAVEMAMAVVGCNIWVVEPKKGLKWGKRIIYGVQMGFKV